MKMPIQPIKDQRFVLNRIVEKLLDDGPYDINDLARMDFSDDGARTWSSEFQRKIGKMGEYGHRIVWRRKGRIQANRVVRFTMTDPVKANIIKLEANAES